MTPKTYRGQFQLADAFDCDYCDLPLWSHSEVELELCYEWGECEKEHDNVEKIKDTFFKA